MMTKKKETSVAVKQETSVAAPQSFGPSSFDGDVTDIVLPRIFAAQKTSRVVDEEKARLADLVRSTTSEVLGGNGSPIEVIPLKHWKNYMITSSGKFVRVEDYNSTTKDLPYDFEEDGRTMKRERVLNFYVLLPGDVSRYAEQKKAFMETGVMPEEFVSVTPCLIGFKSTSYKAGKTLVTHFAEMSEFGAQPYQRTMLLDSDKQQNDMGTFAVLKCSRGKAVKDQAILDVCKKWVEIVNTQSVQVHDEIDEADIVEVKDDF